MVLEQLAAYSDYAALLLRIAIGILFVVHGYPKLFGKEMGLKKVAEFFKSVGITFAPLAALVVGVLEFFGGLALIAGLLTRVIAALLAIQMVVALLVSKFKLKKAFSGGWELDFLLIAALIALAIIGAGMWAIDTNVS